MRSASSGVNRTASALVILRAISLARQRYPVIPVVAHGPQVIARRGIHQLCRDPYAVIGLTYTALEHIPHP